MLCFGSRPMKEFLEDSSIRQSSHLRYHNDIKIIIKFSVLQIYNRYLRLDWMLSTTLESTTGVERLMTVIYNLCKSIGTQYVVVELMVFTPHI